MSLANSAFGYESLLSNTTGIENVANGYQALHSNTTGFQNVANGLSALNSNTTGNNNVAIGSGALFNTTGSNNIALGSQSGSNLTTGSDNIDIGNQGIAGESGIIRIGTAQTDTYLTGIIHADALQIPTGAGASKVLTSDASGNATWQASAGGGTVTNVTGSGPISVATGTTTPAISITKADASADGYLSATDWTAFNSKGDMTKAVYDTDNNGKIDNAATSAASANTPSAIVVRDGSGNFSAGMITANLTGNVTGNATTATTATTATALAGNGTNCPAGQYPLGVDASGNVEGCTASGVGTITSFSSGDLSPLFTSSVATAGSTPALSYTLSNAGAHTFLGNNTGASASPAYVQPDFTDLAGSLAASRRTARTLSARRTMCR